MKKHILIPFDKYERLMEHKDKTEEKPVEQQENVTEPAGQQDKLKPTEIKGEEVMDTSEEVKAKEPEQVEETKPEQVEETKPEQVEDSKPDQSLHKRLAKAIILSFVPKRYKNKADTLLRLVEKNSVLDWNAKGQLLVNGKVVPYSHISDLVRDSVLPHNPFKPQGYKEFYKYLEKVPRYLISLGRRALLGGGVEDTAKEAASVLANWQCLPVQNTTKKTKKTKRLYDLDYKCSNEVL